MSIGTATNFGLSQIILTEEQIQSRVGELGQQISRDYANKEVLLIGVLRGTIVFMADLMRSISIPVSIDFMALSSYGQATKISGVVRIMKDLEESIEERHVLLVEDFIDTGLTLRYIFRNLQARRPASLKVCVMIDKPIHRLADVKVDYVGFQIPNVFVVGYGLDYRQRYRNLRFIARFLP
ncbi:MAG: hypoxanthine phosphoribosyltransferase [Dehalococcoidia bacterium]|nr:hypoxanthine phosphoribosyltransferase [Dehalococcoidia bacterium]